MADSTNRARQVIPIDVERIFLYEENPRHEPIETEPEIIAYLCKEEHVYELARSIASAGPNPLELLGVIQIPGSGSSKTKKNYQVWEGNRRVCAIKLLNDPDLAPAHLRKDFVRLAASSTFRPIKEITSVVFDDHEELKFWMGVIHGGKQGGVGRSDWDSQQIERNIGSGRNRIALAILDTAERLGLITKQERDGKITTAQRYLNSDVVRDAIGIDSSNRDDIAYTRPLPDLKKQLETFINDLKRGTKVHSRSNRAKIDDYGRKLGRSDDLTGTKIPPASLRDIGVGKPSPAQPGTPKKRRRKKRDRLEYSRELTVAIDAVGSEKLESLYSSLHSIGLEDHTPLLTIGLWAFIETVTALDGRNDTTDFHSYCSQQRLGDLGLGNKQKINTIRDALQRIHRNGNATKHHEISAAFDGRQLNNDLKTVTPLLLKTLEKIATPK